MKKSKLWAYKVLVLVVCICFCISCQKQNKEEFEESQTKVNIVAEKSKVRAVLDNYSLAWQTKDMNLFSSIFVHDGDLVIFDGSPAETYIGWEPWKERIQSALDGVNIDDVSFRETKIEVHFSGLAAWMAGKMDWSGVAQNQIIGRDGVRVTMVFEKQDGNWVIVHMHFSLSEEE